jgi:hypothetical protein
MITVRTNPQLKPGADTNGKETVATLIHTNIAVS